MKKVLVDIHSQGVDVYTNDDDKVVLALQRQIPFSENYKLGYGFHFNDEEAFVRLMERIAANYFDCKVEAYAREVFLELPQKYLEELRNEVYKRSKIELKLALEETADMN